jgi:hypothetical protein
MLRPDGGGTWLGLHWVTISTWGISALVPTLHSATQRMTAIWAVRFNASAGTHSALALLDQYIAGGFVFSSDSHSGTCVVRPALNQQLLSQPQA